MLQVLIGHDGREPNSYEVAVRSLLRHASIPVEIIPLVRPHLRGLGLFSRPPEGSTDFSTCRFLVPTLSSASVCVFVDCDVLWRADIAELLALADRRFAVQVVKHDLRVEADCKMDGREQREYPRKLWSSVVVWHPRHPAHQALTLGDVNGRSRDWLHAFGWLPDELIGALPECWNWLPTWSGHHRRAWLGEPKLVHFTEGSPELAGHESQPYASEWREVLADAAHGSFATPPQRAIPGS